MSNQIPSDCSSGLRPDPQPHRRHALMLCGGAVLAAALPVPSQALPLGAAAVDDQITLAQFFTSPAMAEYKRRLAEYKEARAAFDEEASAYWSAVSEKRKTRNAKRRDRVEVTADDYMLEQPPVYSGPKRPVNPEPEPEPEKETRPPKYIPVVADFLRAAAQHFQFSPQRPAAEIDFKRAYART
ncbi:hypothetical protein ACGE32_29075, partial [Klebsiella pneumoniae]